MKYHTITIIPNESGQPAGKLADVEVHFHEGLLAGLKLIGFAIWQTRRGDINITVPARTYRVNGESRAFALLRPVADPAAMTAIREAIIAAWNEHAIAQTPPSPPVSVATITDNGVTARLSTPVRMF